MDVHKDCYSAINLTQQGGPYRRETNQFAYSDHAGVGRDQDSAPPLIGHTTVSSAAKSSLCWQTVAKTAGPNMPRYAYSEASYPLTNWAAV
jgi:hypothetical protein